MEKQEINVKEIITRRRYIEGKNYWLTTNSFKEHDKWYNCIYLHFCKENFPQFKYPDLKHSEYKSMKKFFDYYNSDFSEIDFHCGITFYEETYLPDTNKTYVKVGADYQHLNDDHYMMEDHGKLIIGYDGDLIIRSFEELIQKRIADGI